ncbi:hypothetical protein [uncultured Marivirga sp.]|uniref:hypothetical protein n=1 Tax=uncultured Marivirga sp. TaxID=1123707 RepID=UPI0030EBA1C5
MKSNIRYNRELVLVLFIISGSIKSIFIYYKINLYLDLTLLAGLLMVADLLIYKHNIKNAFITNNLLLVSFTFYVFLSLVWSESTEFKYIKVFLFFTNILGYFYSTVVIDKLNKKLFWEIFIVITTLASLWFSTLLRGYIDGSNYSKVKPILGFYLSSSLYAGISIIVLYLKTVFIKRPYIKYFFLFTNIVLLAILGGRAPILFLILTIVSLSIVNYKSIFRSIRNIKVSKNQLFSIPFGVSALIGTIFFFYETIQILAARTLQRLQLIFERIFGSNITSDMSSTNERIEHYNFSFEKITNGFSEFLFGYGFGSYGIYKLGQDIKLYPHNILLEMLFEVGLVGTSLLIMFIYFNVPKKITIFAMAISIFLLLNFLKSYSIIDIRIFFCLIPLIYFNNERK